MTPNKIKIVEVGPRDGLQNETIYLPLEDKVSFIKNLVSSGLREIEVTSFVRSDRVPQLRDSKELFNSLQDIQEKNDVSMIALVPNLKGMEAALSAGVKRVALFTATSEKFNQNNINSSIGESIKKIREVASICRTRGISIRGYISTVFGCPYEGKKTTGNMERIIKSLQDMGADEISFGDTIGVGTPDAVESRLEEIFKFCDTRSVAMHFHDTYGRGLANVYAALKNGVEIFDTSAGGMGGCPYAKGASGNLATEDLVSMLNEMNIEHGADLKKIVNASSLVLEKLSRKSSSKVHEVVKLGK